LLMKSSAEALRGPIIINNNNNYYYIFVTVRFKMPPQCLLITTYVVLITQIHSLRLQTDNYCTERSTIVQTWSWWTATCTAGVFVQFTVTSINECSRWWRM